MADIRAEVMGQIRALRRRIDPRLLEQVRNAVYFGQRSEKENARAAVASFLNARDDGGAFRRKLEAELGRHGKKLDALLPAAAPTSVAGGSAPASAASGGDPAHPRLSAEALLSAPLPQRKPAGKPGDKPGGKSGNPPKSFWRKLF